MFTRDLLSEGLKSVSRQTAYSSVGRQIARKILSIPEASTVRTKIKHLGAEEKIRHIATESLEPGYYYAKLVIKNWRHHLGKDFQLLQDDNVVYGNVIETPPQGKALEYRNIIVTSTSHAAFSLNIDAQFTISIGLGAFFTREQENYDKRYGIRRHGRLHYAIRGNQKNPEKLIFTFPGFSTSTTTIPHVVSYLSGLSATDLQKTMIVCFQDRYGTSGSYMQLDNSGLELNSAVALEIEKIRRRHGVQESQMMFYGASKGASIAIVYSEPYPEAKLVVSTPQLHLGYYLDKPHFRNNLAKTGLAITLPQPHSLLRQYVQEGRAIEYFYSSSDEDSNYSLPEQLFGYKGVSLYRIDGSHGDVAKKCTFTLLNIIRNFLSVGEEKYVKCKQIRKYDRQIGSQYQLRVVSPEEANPGTNWYLVEKKNGVTRNHILTQGSIPFLKYTSTAQMLLNDQGTNGSLTQVVGYQADGTRWVADNLHEHPELDFDNAHQSATIHSVISLALYESMDSQNIRIFGPNNFSDFIVSVPYVVKDPQKILFVVLEEGFNAKVESMYQDYSSSNIGLVYIWSKGENQHLDILIKRIFIDSGAASYTVERRTASSYSE
ncbi:hypothetical protein [Glutamicibacter halophytocola]|uniref:Uncharacterized protein n=1 Tax=Glutamicibacter halophytocola TaxID=1933880 RepID=A0AA95BTM2_9MICC|nr:hypothetical protein [Glutamicibacter halophytocola]UUX60387.1 hypothetical protein NUH22_07195 [Glutamicibacter halophytocola]